MISPYKQILHESSDYRTGTVQIQMSTRKACPIFSPLLNDLRKKNRLFKPDLASTHLYLCCPGAGALDESNAKQWLLKSFLGMSHGQGSCQKLVKRTDSFITECI